MLLGRRLEVFTIISALFTSAYDLHGRYQTDGHSNDGPRNITTPIPVRQKVVRRP